ncbi:DNA cytosine methyltransferase [uncultured Pontibacter sp.]|uniref:DNA cytosine methyltransferase n=1 Tax=uncultured Pontibacter sp. TaxID=453356 RepID=UPI00261CEDE7|nr:DNA cytosine methyltransferase [uncultured Pontibacter sp.]
MSEQTAWDRNTAVEESSYYWKKEPVAYPGKYKPGSRPTVVELFCGCGGTSTGFLMAGYDILLGLDILKPAIETFRANHAGAAAVLGDVSAFNPESIAGLTGGANVDVLIGGIPCQGFSLNNRKRHDDDKRNFMYREFIRYVQALQPKVVVLENVSNIRSAGGGTFVKAIEEEIGMAAGMKVTSHILYAPDYGVPQKRKRMIFVGVREATFNFDSVLKTHGPGTGKPYVTILDAIGDLPGLQPGESKHAYKCDPFTSYQKLMRSGASEILTGHTAPKHPAATIERIRTTIPGKPMYEKFPQRIRLAWDILSPTQVSGGIRPQFQFGHPEDNRGLSIRERCRLQSFPDTFEVKGGIVQGRVQTGNAVPPLLAKAVALALKPYLR